MKRPAETLKEALRLAARGEGLVSPNPMVGALVLQGSRVVARGYHRAVGLPHAEVEALKEAGERARGGILAVNLEPCCHQGRTPPCTDAIVRAGIREVICCMRDPNPLVDGKGFRILQEHGITVRSGYLQEEAERLNEAYLTRMLKERPYVILKWAQTLDGRIAAASGDSKWITGEKTREFSRRMRFGCDAILVGIETILADDPLLDYAEDSFQARKALLERKRYLKVILDSRLRTPVSARIWENPRSHVVIFTSGRASRERYPSYEGRNVRIVAVAERGGGLDVREILGHLQAMEVGIVLVEGGRKVLTSFWNERLADRLHLFIGNRILGGQHSLCPLEGSDPDRVEWSARLEQVEHRALGEDFHITGRICFPES